MIYLARDNEQLQRLTSRKLIQQAVLIGYLTDDGRVMVKKNRVQGVTNTTISIKQWNNLTELIAATQVGYGLSIN